MIQENRKLLHHLHIISDGLILFLTLPLAFWLRFYALPDGVISVPLSSYLILASLLTLTHLLLYAFCGLYDSSRVVPLRRELFRQWLVSALIAVILLSVLFIGHEVHYSRLTLAAYFAISTGLLSCKRIFTLKFRQHFSVKGYFRKHVLILGCGTTANRYLEVIHSQQYPSYQALGCVADRASFAEADSLQHLGDFSQLEAILNQLQPDEVIAAMDAEEQYRIPQIITDCEKAGIKLSIIPFYAQYVTSVPEFDKIGDLPLLNIRRIPLENLGNAFFKRTMDIIASLLLIIVTAPIMLICAIGVRLSSPGPVIFRQQRVGRGNRNFNMYKFRSMRVNDEQNTRWSTDRDDRKTTFGAFLRKYSLDEFPQFFNVLKGDMSLVGPRPELPHFVTQFKEEIPLYMVKHQVRPGITGWAQVNGLRGDTSITARVEHDIYYIEHWSMLFDIKILLTTVFGGKFKNSEQLR